MDLSYDEVIRRYTYDPITGDICHRQTGRRYEARNQAGAIQITVGTKSVPAHRLAWFLHHGEWPKGRLRHKDGNRTNNAISNLEPIEDARRMEKQGNFSIPEKPMPSYEEMASYFHYDPVWGTVIRTRTGRPCSAVASPANGRKVQIVRHKGRSFAMHRVVWLLVTREWPKRRLMHLDGDPTNNRFDNLQERF